MADVTYARNLELEALIPLLVEKFPDDLGDIGDQKVVVVSVFGKISRRGDCVVFGKCRKLTEPVKMFTVYEMEDDKLANSGEVDFIIEMFEDAINEQDFEDDQDKQNLRRIILLHECGHVGPDGRIKPHTFEDFYWLVKRFGVDYLSPGKTIDLFKED